MKFLCIYKSSKPEGTPPTQREMAEMGKLIEESVKSGILISTEGCLPSAKGARVRLSSGKFTVTDGPFTESKEIVGGFALIRANSKEEAIEHTKDFLKIAGDGETEVRQIFEPTDFVAPGSEPNHESLVSQWTGESKNTEAVRPADDRLRSQSVEIQEGTPSECAGWSRLPSIQLARMA